MIRAIALALTVAAANVLISRALLRSGAVGAGVAARGGFWRLQGLGFFFRLTIILASAHWVWRMRHDAREVAVLIFLASVAQTAGQIFISARKPLRRPAGTEVSGQIAGN